MLASQLRLSDFLDVTAKMFSKIFKKILGVWLKRERRADKPIELSATSSGLAAAACSSRPPETRHSRTMSTPRRAGASAAPSDTPNSGLRSRTNTSPKRSALEAANGTGNDASSASNGSASNSANGNIKPPSSQSQSNSTISNYISTLMALARLKMAVFSAVTYSAAFTLGLRLAQSTSSGSVFDYETFIFGWLFMFTCQLSAHLLGEYYDLPSDSLNKGGPFTGGSKVLVAGRGDPKLALYWGWVATACAMTLLGGSYEIQFKLSNSEGNLNLARPRFKSHVCSSKSVPARDCHAYGSPPVLGTTSFAQPPWTR